MAGSILGNRVARTEDPELLTVGGTYVADLKLADVVHAHFIRSVDAHARIVSIDIDDALAAPGVVAVLTADTLGVAPHQGFVPVGPAFARRPLAGDTVRYVGEAIVMVLAETLAQAVDAAELVIIDTEPLDAVVDPEASFDAAAIFDGIERNIALSAVDPDVDVFGDADHIVRGRFVNQRVSAVPIEPNSCASIPAGHPAGDPDRIVFYGANQMPHMLQGQMASALGISKRDIRVITPHVGGGFGAKAGICHENSAVAAAATHIGRPVTWTETRSESMVALVHSRAQVQYAELGVRNDGTFTGMRVRLVGDAGAYPNVGAMLPAGTKRMSHGTYDFDAIRFDLAVAITNTTPTGAYRGAGRPEAAALLERLVDQAAIEMTIDPLELRKRNFLRPDQFPFTTLTGVTYDTGDYAATLDTAASLAGYDELRAEQARRRVNGDRVQLGIGVASYVEVTSGGGGSEFGALDIHPDGTATMHAGTSAHGQGHQISYAMLVSAQTGIDVDKIRLVQSDTDKVRTGGGTGGSRSLQLAGSAISEATEQVVLAGRELAAELLEANVEDIVVDTESGTVGVAGVPARALDWGQLAAAAAERDTKLAAEIDFKQANGTFPFGTHISVVEVDLDTGEVTMLRHIGVDDAGTVINELVYEGQQHGGIAQGAAQALFEEVLYDDMGNPVTASLMDYAIPSAAEFSSFEAHHTVTPTPLNPLGAKGIGEAATIGATPAIQNAVIDAVSHLGIRHLDMPCTPRRVWAAINAAGAGSPPEPWREPPAIFDDLVAAAAVSSNDGRDAAEAAADASESI